MTGLYIRQEMVRAMSATESLMFVAGKIFGKQEPQREVDKLSSVNDMLNFAKMVNG